MKSLQKVYRIDKKLLTTSFVQPKFSKTLIALGLSTLCSLVLGCSEAQQEQATQTLKLDEKDVFSLKVGTCFNDPSGSNIEVDELVSDVPIRECTKPHDNEVFHIFELTGMTDMRDAKAVEDQVYSQCSTAYTAFVGKPYEDSTYDMNYLAPSDESWATGDREITCYIYNPEAEQMSASMKGSGV